MPVPPDFRKGYTSIYELQSTMGGGGSGGGAMGA
jgi:hypothetical protein